MPRGGSEIPLNSINAKGARQGARHQIGVN